MLFVGSKRDQIDNPRMKRKEGDGRGEMGSRKGGKKRRN
jgi:hypothetical protein